MSSKVKQIIFFYFFISALVFGLVGFVFLAYDNSLKIYFLDVGQGDATLIKTPDYRYVLIDGGPDNRVVYKLGEYLPFYVRTIDLVVLTHPDNDHSIGLNEIIKRYQVKNILLTGVADDSAAYQNILNLANDKNIKFLFTSQADGIKLTDEIIFNILYPKENIIGVDMTQDNDWSIVNRLDYGSECVLLMGDATKKVEQKLLAEHVNLNCDILKIGHHGSNTSSEQNFLEVVSPKLAVISVGQNNYGHPHQVVMDRLNNLKIPVLTTKADSDIIVTLKKDGWFID